MSSNLIARISIIVYALITAMFGIHHLQAGASMAGAVPHFFPAPVFFVYFTGVAFILAAISFLINMKVKLAGYLLGTLLLIIVFSIHFPAFMTATDEASRMMPQINILKDLGLAAAAFYIGSKHS